MFHVEQNNMNTIKGNIANVREGFFFKGEIFIKDGKITEIEKKDVVENVYILPGLIDSHVHIESSMVSPEEFSRIAVSHGTVAVVSDPHEIANVNGIDGINYMINSSNKADIKFFFGCPSCVPATAVESSGARIDSDAVRDLLKRDDIYFLSEMMNFPGVICQDSEVIKKINYAIDCKKPIDGHAPMLKGSNLIKYIKYGISTDHECSSIDEALVKINHGMKIQIREGSAAKNFNQLKSLIDTNNDSVMLCTDDCHPDELLKHHINKFFKKPYSDGINFFNLLRAATINPKMHYDIDVGSLSVGDSADFIIVDNLNDFNVLKTYINGKEVFCSNKGISARRKREKIIINNFNTNKVFKNQLIINEEKALDNIIEIVNGELITNIFKHQLKFIEKEGYKIDVSKDILKIVVKNRYNESIPSLGFVKNFGLKKGAIASSIAHDSHNIICIGVDDESIKNAINKLIDLKGGIVYYCDGIFTKLKLDISGIMSTESIYKIAKEYCEIEKLLIENGVKICSPLMSMAFLSLIVIPDIKICDKGLFDVKKFKLI